MILPISIVYLANKHAVIKILGEIKTSSSINFLSTTPASVLTKNYSLPLLSWTLSTTQIISILANFSWHLKFFADHPIIHVSLCLGKKEGIEKANQNTKDYKFKILSLFPSFHHFFQQLIAQNHQNFVRNKILKQHERLIFLLPLQFYQDQHLLLGIITKKMYRIYQ